MLREVASRFMSELGGSTQEQPEWDWCSGQKCDLVLDTYPTMALRPPGSARYNVAGAHPT